MLPRRVLHFLVVALLLLPPFLRGAEGGRALRLVATVNEQEFDDFAVTKGELLLRSADGSTQPAQRGIKWGLEGNLAANWQSIYFFPRFRIVTRGAIQPSPEVRTRTHGLVWHYRDEAWSQSETNRGILVIAWLVEGKPAWVEAMPAHVPQEYSSAILAYAARELDATTVSGVPVALLWRDGEFSAPLQRFKNPRMSELAAALHLAADEEFAQLLAATPVRRLDDRNELASITLRAARGHWPDRLQKLLAAGGRADDSWHPPLLEAASNGRSENVQLLLHAGVSGTGPRNTSWSPADWALGRGHLDLGLSLLPERDRRGAYRALRVALELGSAKHVSTLIERIGKVRWKNVSQDILAQVWEFGDPELARTLEAAGVKPPAKPASVPESPALGPTEIDLLPVLAQRARLTGASRWRYDSSYGFGLLAEPAREAESLGDRILNVDEQRRGGPTLTGLPVGMWTAASIIVEPDGTASRVQMIDGFSEPFAQAVERMLKASTFLAGEHGGVPVRTRFTLMVLAD